MVAMILVLSLWPSSDPVELDHLHLDLPPNHPHLSGASHAHHRHPFRIDTLHKHWPKSAQ
jgi:hypothetical protein